MKKNNTENIRNFSIIAHIDHGKSTLADRFLELALKRIKSKFDSQYLDSMEIEQERGITIKLNCVKLDYKPPINKNYKYPNYIFNLIDTPGHVDFTYEVSRALAACEGAILLVDATQGIQAQTVANAYLAIEEGLEIIPVINKIDMPTANIDKVKQQLIDTFGFKYDDIISISAKTGENIDLVCCAIIEKIPFPRNNTNKTLRALIFDSYYDRYQGAVGFIRIVDGILKKGEKIKLMSVDSEYFVTEIGIKSPDLEPCQQLSSGEVGWFTGSIKSIKDLHVGDTVTLVDMPAQKALKGYKKLTTMVYCGIYPVDNKSYNNLKSALEKLSLSDSSFMYEPETSQALGFGFRCGFLGLLHLEITQERLEREYNLELITTAPSTAYEVLLTNGASIKIDNPSKMPNKEKIKVILEPVVIANLIFPITYLGSVMQLCQDYRGEYVSFENIDSNQTILKYKLPLNEIMYDFYGKLKSLTRGYGSLDYSFDSYKPATLVKLDVLLNGVVVDALSSIVYKKFAYNRGRELCLKLKDVIPKQNFEIAIQAAISSKIIARETIKAYRKDVTAKLYGGHVERKKKLLKKQKKGKKRLKQIGNVTVSQSAFMTILETKKN